VDGPPARRLRRLRPRLGGRLGCEEVTFHGRLRLRLSLGCRLGLRLWLRLRPRRQRPGRGRPPLRRTGDRSGPGRSDLPPHRGARLRRRPRLHGRGREPAWIVRARPSRHRAGIDLLDPAQAGVDLGLSDDGRDDDPVRAGREAARHERRKHHSRRGGTHDHRSDPERAQDDLDPQLPTPFGRHNSQVPYRQARPRS
jgi:hypothetical protein